jgi:hypothetical protein
MIAFGEHPADRNGGIASRYARTHHFLVGWSEVETAGGRLTQSSEREMLVVLPDVGAELITGAARVIAPARSICVLPAGTSTIVPAGRGTVIRLFEPAPAALAERAINRADYATRRAGIRPVGAPFRRVGPVGPRVHPLERRNGGQPQSFQTETMSVGWFEQDGPQDPSSVFPHAHGDFEEGSLMVAGTYVQHLRTPWGTDLRGWRPDEHLRCGPGTLVVIPPETLHVAEATGGGHHAMMNLFAPPRADHIAKGQIRNAAEYAQA